MNYNYSYPVEPESSQKGIQALTKYQESTESVNHGPGTEAITTHKLPSTTLKSSSIGKKFEPDF